MKYNNRHGMIWSQVERIQCAPDREARPRVEVDTKRSELRDLKNAYRL